MPSRAEIAKMGGDDDREDKERVMAGFLSGSVHVRSFHKHTDILFQEHSSVGVGCHRLIEIPTESITERKICRTGTGNTSTLAKF